MHYFFGSLLFIIFSLLGFFNINSTHNNSYQNWNENPARYLIENPNGEYFIKALELIDKSPKSETFKFSCRIRKTIEILINYEGQALIDDELYNKEDRSKISSNVKEILENYFRDTIYTDDLAKKIDANDVLNTKMIDIAINYGEIINTHDEEIISEVAKGIKLFMEDLIYTGSQENIKTQKEKISITLSNKLKINKLVHYVPLPQ